LHEIHPIQAVQTPLMIGRSYPVKQLSQVFTAVHDAQVKSQGAHVSGELL